MSCTWETGPRVAELGEFAVIARLRTLLGEPAGLTLGMGDDAALLEPPADGQLVWTCDMLISGRHFLPEWMSPREVGTRAAEVNLSDIAAMGAEPHAALISLGLPPAMHYGALEGIYTGLHAAFSRHGAVIAGGNIARAEDLILDISVLGSVAAGRALRRSGAAVGDVVFVTGEPGRAAAALTAFRARERIAPDLLARLRPAYVAPSARIAVGRYLGENQLASAALDQSDGLVGDLVHLCEESGVGVLLDFAHLPMGADLCELGNLLAIDPHAWVLGASDDYELLFTAPPGATDRIMTIPALFDLPVAPIGQVVAAPGKILIETNDGETREITGGWDHLR